MSKQNFWQKDLQCIVLSPLHIGCDQELEPTEYVIENRAVHQFRGSDLWQILSEKDLEELMKLAENAQNSRDILKLRSFFKRHKQAFVVKAFQHYLVSEGLENKYEESLTKETHAENHAQNSLELDRVVHHPISQQAYLPGSSLKGALRTAITNARIQKKGPNLFQREKDSQKIEKKIYGYQNSTEDPFKNLKVSDSTVASFIVQKFQIAKNFKIREKKEKSKARLPVQLETVQIGGVFDFKVVFHQMDNKFTTTIEEMIKDLNSFYGTKLRQQLNDFAEDKRLDSQWKQSLNRLLTEINPLIESNKAAIVRLGHYAGAESKSYDDIRKIKNAAAKGAPTLKKSTTFWLTDEGYPLGWCLILDPFVDGEIRQKIEEILSPLTSPIQEQMAQLTASLQEIQKAQEEAEKRAQQEAEEQKRLNEMTEAQRAIYLLQKAFKEAKRFNLNEPSGPLRTQLSELIRQAEVWQTEDKEALLQLAKDLFKYWGINIKKNKKVKEQLNKLKTS